MDIPIQPGSGLWPGQSPTSIHSLLDSCFQEMQGHCGTAERLCQAKDEGSHDGNLTGGVYSAF